MKKKKLFIAYEGTEYTIEWYWDSRNKSLVLEYFENLDKENKKKIFKLFELMGNQGQIRNTEKFRNEDDKIYAFKSPPNRFLCFFFEGSKIILTNAFEKKAQKLPPEEKRRALLLKDDYIKRVNKGDYYD